MESARRHMARFYRPTLISGRDYDDNCTLLNTSAALTQFLSPRENRLEHLGRQPSGVGIVSATVITIDQYAAIGEYMLGKMRELIVGKSQFLRSVIASQKTVMRDFA